MPSAEYIFLNISQFPTKRDSWALSVIVRVSVVLRKTVGGGDWQISRQVISLSHYHQWRRSRNGHNSFVIHLINSVMKTNTWSMFFLQE